MKNYWKVGDYAKQLRWNDSSLYFQVTEVRVKQGTFPFRYIFLMDEIGLSHPSYMCEKTTKEHYLIGQY